MGLNIKKDGQFLGGQVFDVPESLPFEDKPLHVLLAQVILYGNSPDVQEGLYPDAEYTRDHERIKVLKIF
ncbi:MAG: hypothetical protein V1862_08185 [Methanobacteriota archaeon]